MRTAPAIKAYSPAFNAYNTPFMLAAPALGADDEDRP